MNGEVIASMRLNLPLPFKWEIFSSQFDFRVHQVKKSIEALKKMSSKYKIKTQVDNINKYELSKLFMLTQ